jgi:hypothetical protein
MALQRWRTWGGLAGINAIIDAINNISGSSLLSGSVVNATLSDMIQATVKRRPAGAGTGVPQDLNANQISTVLDAASDPFVRTSASASVDERGRVRAATTANITIATALNNGDVLDGVTLATGDLVLVKNQSSAAENGVYVVGTSPARTSAYDTYDKHPGRIIVVQEGTAGADTLWLCTSNKGGTINSTALAFTQIAITNGPGSIQIDGHLHGITRQTGDGAAVTFDLSDIAEYLELVSVNGAVLDPLLVTLSSDGSQITLSSAPTAGHVIVITYVIASI